MPPAFIRPATPADLPAINDIYNHYVLHSTCTYQLQPETPEGRARWFAGHDALHPVTVVQRAGAVVAWGSLSHFHGREAYCHTVEDSVYVRHDLHRQGVGSAILADLIVRARELGHHTIIARISAEQTASVALHARHGFLDAGCVREVGYKLGKWLDVLSMQYML